MKFVALTLVAVVGMVTVFKGDFFSNKGSTSSTPSSIAESVTVQSNSVSGNIADSRLMITNKLVSTQKTVLKAKADPKRVLYLNSQVSFESSQRIANGIKELNAKSSEPIFLLIDSPGGSVLDGATVLSEIEASKAPVYTVCTRLCASMAAMIHSYGHKRYATDRALLMYHPASGGAQGQVPNMVSQLGTITRYLDKMSSNIVARSHLSKDDFDKLVAYELWIDAEDSLNKGLIDGIINLNVPSYEQELTAPEMQPGDKIKHPKSFDVQLISPYLDLWNH